MNIGIIREGKVPPDSRVPLTPRQAQKINANFPVQVFVQPSALRCYTDVEYQQAGVTLSPDLLHCDVLMGVKEVPIEQLMPNKTYFFFSHTIKKQPYNRQLLQAILEKNSTLIDYEVLTNAQGKRVIAFGKFAGMVGAHNALWTYAQRTKAFELPRLSDFQDYAAAKSFYETVQFPAVKIVLTGTGRVGQGAALVLKDMGIRKVSPEDFLEKEFEEAVFTQLRCEHYVTHQQKKAFSTQHFYAYPGEYKSIFEPYTQAADIMINGIFWDNEAPAFFTREDMQHSDFNIQVISDVTCDIAPVSSIPSTLRATTIDEPVFGYDPQMGTETTAFQPHVIDMMTIDNLPNELPRDASKSFGEQFIEHVLPELLKSESAMIGRATIATGGALTKTYHYLQGYVDGEE